jgi:hypothetical protein
LSNRLSLDDNCEKQVAFDARDTSRTTFVLGLLRLTESGLHQAGGERGKCD